MLCRWVEKKNARPPLVGLIVPMTPKKLMRLIRSGRGLDLGVWKPFSYYIVGTRYFVDPRRPKNRNQQANEPTSLCVQPQERRVNKRAMFT